MQSDFDLAEMLWDVADPHLTDSERSTMCIALHLAPLLVVHTALTALVCAHAPLPANVFDELSLWLGGHTRLSAHDPSLDLRLDIILLASDVERSQFTVEMGRYAPVTLCCEILEAAGVNGKPLPEQVEAVRCWLLVHRPSPALRVDLIECGFGHLIG